MCRKIKIRRIANFSVVLFPNLKWLWNLEAKTWSEHITNVTVCHKHSFLLILALKTSTCVMSLIVLAWSKFNPSLIKIPIPYRLLMGFWLRIGVSTIILCAQRSWRFLDIIGQNPSVFKSNLLHVDMFRFPSLIWGIFHRFLLNNRWFSQSPELQSVVPQTQLIHL